MPWPKIDGVINAIVDGERQSTGTSIDDEGRYRVVLPMDEAGTSGGSASRWVRRAQPSAGAGYGMHMPLHIGTEVAIAHVNGDPSRSRSESAKVSPSSPCLSAKTFVVTPTSPASAEIDSAESSTVKYIVWVGS